jgi:DNA-binding MarR family transcriptional regulator
MNKMPLRAAVDLSGTGRCVAFTLRKATRAITQRYDAALRGTGVRSTQFALLVAVAKHQPVSVGTLAELMVSDATTMTRGLRLLQARGLLSVSARSAGRRRLVALTAPGRRTLARAVGAWRRAQAEFVGEFGVRDWERLRRGLERLRVQARAEWVRAGAE